MSAVARRRCAQPQTALSCRADRRKLAVFSSKLWNYVIEFRRKNRIGEKIANPCGRPIRRAPAKLARRSSTTLSTVIVDKQKIVNASPTYHALLHRMTTSCRKS